MAIKTYSKAKDGELSLSANFKVKEFASKDGVDTILIDSELVRFLQKIRDYFQSSITISSGYRTIAHNKNIGG